MQSRVSSFPTEKSTENSMLQSNHPQHSFFSSDFTTRESVKQDGQSLRPFFDEWPKNRDAWSGLENDSSNQTSFSTTQLSISIPMASSDFSTSCRSPRGEFFLGDVWHYLMCSCQCISKRKTLWKVISTIFILKRWSYIFPCNVHLYLTPGLDILLQISKRALRIHKTKPKVVLAKD